LDANDNEDIKGGYSRIHNQKMLGLSGNDAYRIMPLYPKSIGVVHILGPQISAEILTCE
jgi:hypothetical protein